ncbi:MAG: NUDIX domain-containing protein [Microthrixaceae bacterium]|nr:NUDIX domain-containing protein [Microthrixaceae bacterium]
MPQWPRRRRAARVVVFDPLGRLLLISAKDPGSSDGRNWWEIPGGGIDPGEQSHETARRELWEEAGISEARIGPVVWTQTVEFTFGGWHFDQDEWIHIATCDGRSDGPGGLESLEALAFGEQRWWHPEELIASGERTIPYRLAEFLPSVLDRLPALLEGDSSHEQMDISPTQEHIRSWQNH